MASYRNKRDLRATTEPRDKRGRSQPTECQYVVHLHAASHLHYDFRLALDGVLKSWAVPKGPSLDPRQKRLAVEVEDHPLDHADFEGVIPEGQYGAGTVMVWDRGAWTPDDDPHRGLQRGKLEFHLHGEKLHGGWVLVRTRTASQGRNAWLLMKRQDEFARSNDESVLDEHPKSVKTGCDMQEIAAGALGQRKRRKSKATATSAIGEQTVMASRTRGKRKMVAPPGARRARLPDVFRPQLATLVDKPPTSDQWWHETKLDGNRIALRIAGKKVDVWSRRMLSWTERLPHLVEAAKRLPVRSALLDGELVAIEANGTTSLQSLQTAFRENRSSQLIYYAFDILHRDGYDLTGCSLETRKDVLSRLLSETPDVNRVIRCTEHAVGRGPEAFKKACELGLEGIVSKRRDAPYTAGRGTNWLKAKCFLQEEFVIGGFTEPKGARKHFGALLVGYYEGPDLRYAGRVGAGFGEETLRDLSGQLERLEQRTPPFAPSAVLQAHRKGVHWVAPKLVAQVRFSGWTRDVILRQPSFQGLREDKPAREVVREKPADPGRATEKSPRPPSPLWVRFTNANKVLYQGQGITKLDLANYYSAVAEWMMPHLAGRPLTLVRCPGGADSECFLQKHADKGRPEHVRLTPITEAGKTNKYLVVDDLAGLLSLVQMATLEIHAWGSRVEDLERPDRLTFDLDPDPSVPWTTVVESAAQLKALFDDLGLRTFLKTTGGKGLHIVLPIVPDRGWPQVSRFCKALADAVAGSDPNRYTSRSTKAAREGRIFLDYCRNSRGATAIVPYSTRVRPGATVATPIAWSELNANLESDSFNVNNVPQRLSSLRHDPWREIDRVRQTIGASLAEKLKRL